MATYLINHNVATDANKKIAVIKLGKPNISLAFLQTNLNAAALINYAWSNDEINTVPLLDSNLDPISTTLASVSASTTGILLAAIPAKYLHISIAKQTATVGIITEIQTNEI